MSASRKVGCRIVLSSSDIPASHARLADVTRWAAAKYGLAVRHVREVLRDLRSGGGEGADALDSVKLLAETVASEQGFRVAPVYVNAAAAEEFVRRVAEASAAATVSVEPEAVEPAARVDVEPAVVPVSVSADVEALAVELGALRASVGDLAAAIRNLQAAVELRTEGELSATPRV